ncbi:SH3 domain-containing protein (plasmid) [Bosea vestrisii]|uniref:SH3 domain-containing protein n=1 Tax=Bosea vestrisii TaxID=151416 RepID=UPI0024DFEB4E|nr:SH3 domain-containing protein [Bosea vestrisii]WID99689.1 SH3 domain-containing protein [Bosea vestrisii]
MEANLGIDTMGRAQVGLIVGVAVLAAAIFGEKNKSAPTSKPVAAVGLELPSSPPAAQAYLPGPVSRPALVNRSLAPTDLRLPERRAVPPKPNIRSLYVTGKEVPLREAPDGNARILDRLPTGMEVAELARREGWVEVRHPITAVEGWMSTRRLTTVPPREVDSEKRPPNVIAPLDTAAIVAALIARSMATYSGNCACPYHTDRAGRSCGRRSAHSRGGGRAPLCFADDVTPSMIANYKARGGR